MARPKPTIADLRARKGKGQLTMLRVMSLDEAAAAQEAGIDNVTTIWRSTVGGTAHQSTGQDGQA
jgi:putative N-acetylmannosamine-6-phosphate epimerase